MTTQLNYIINEQPDPPEDDQSADFNTFMDPEHSVPPPEPPTADEKWQKEWKDHLRSNGVDHIDMWTAIEAIYKKLDMGDIPITDVR